MNAPVITLLISLLIGASGFAQWTPLNPPTTGQMSGVSFVDPSTGFIGGVNGEIYKTTDGGTTWSSQVSGISDNIFAIDYVNPTTAYACASSGTGKILKTTDGGTTWISQTFPSSSYLLDINFPSDSVGYCVGYNGLILKTVDWGTNWAILNSGTSSDLRGVHFVDANNGYISMQSGNILKTTDGGSTWTVYSTSTGALLLDIYFTDVQTGYAVGASGSVVKTTNAGLNWSSLPTGTTEFLQSVHFVSPNKGYAVGGSGAILSTIDGGTTWSLQYEGSFSSNYGWYGVTFSNSVGYVVGFGGEAAKIGCSTTTSGVDVQSSCGSYTWIDGNTYGASNNTATYTLTNAAGCDSTVTLDLTINSPTSGTDTQVACNSYVWIDGNTYTSSNNIATHTLMNAAGCDSIVTLDLTINTIVETVTNSDPELIADASGVSYQWIDCSDNSIIPNETSQSFTATANGSYAVILSDGICVDTSQCASILTTSIGSLSLEMNVLAYPNPSEKGVFTIDLDDSYETVESVRLENAMGQTVVNRFQPQQSKFTIEADTSGVYILRIETKKAEEHTLRLVRL